MAAALAVWEYADESVRCVFGDSTGDPVADDILGFLRNAPAGLPRTAIRELTGKHLAGETIGRALGVLGASGLAARMEPRDTGGRPAEVWFARPRGAGRG